jgi:hypothetical protein
MDLYIIFVLGIIIRFLSPLFYFLKPTTEYGVLSLFFPDSTPDHQYYRHWLIVCYKI